VDKQIEELTGIGRGKKCILIGGGRSVLRFDFTNVESFVKIGCNEAGIMLTKKRGIKTEYMIFYDYDFSRALKNYCLPESVTVICSNKALIPNAHYQYRAKRIGVKQEDNIGKKALVIAHDVMQFDEIYLIGYDFTTEQVDGKEVSHFFGDPVGHDKKYIEDMKVRDHFKRLPEMVKQFDDISHYKNVYNLNKDSLLKVYPFLGIKEETCPQ
jgi:hypothetical protein